MRDIFEQFTTNPTTEVDGRWHPYAGGEILVARQYNKLHSKDFLAQLEAHKPVLDQKTDESDALADRLTAESQARHVLKAIKGFKHKVNGELVDLPDTFENRVRLMLMRDFKIGVIKLADDFTQYLAVQEEEDAKNSPTPLSGT